MLCYIRCPPFTRCRSTVEDIVPKVGVKCNVEQVLGSPSHIKRRRLAFTLALCERVQQVDKAFILYYAPSDRMVDWRPWV